MNDTQKTSLSTVPPKKRLYVAVAPDGAQFKRCTGRMYTHAVLVWCLGWRDHVWKWHIHGFTGSAALAAKSVAARQKHLAPGERVEVVEAQVWQWRRSVQAYRAARDANMTQVSTLRLPRRTLESLANSEEGRHEDIRCELAEYEAASEPKGDKPEPCLAYTCAMEALESSASSKYVTIRVDRADVAGDLYYAVCSGTFQLQFPKTARDIANVLREWVRVSDPELVKRWPAPTGA
jgi:hypothetical protein